MGVLWYTINMRIEESAYIAGIIDGEGTVTLHRKTISVGRKRYQAWEYYIGVTLTQKAFMNAIKEMVNVGKGQVRNNPRNLKGRANQSYRVKWSGSHCISILKEIRPFLLLKAPQADIILNFAQKQEEAQSQRSGQGHRYPDWLHNLAGDIEKQMKILNKRGIDRQAQF